MYTLTRKLSVVCLTVVLSFLVYGCGGSSKQATITDVSTDMVTAGLTPDSGTYTIQPGGTATAGDVTFACPAEGSSCEVTVADDGTVTSAGGMATAMDSASATKRLAAEAARDTAIQERDDARLALTTAQADLTTAQEDLTTAQADLMTAQADLTTAQADLMTAQADLTTAQANLMTAQTDLTTTQADLTTAQADLTTAQANLTTAQTDLMTAQTDLTTAQGERDDALLAKATAEGERDDALLAKAAAEEEARLLTTVTPIKPDLAPDYDRVATTDIYKVEPGETKAVPNSDVQITCPLKGGIRCTVVVAVNDDGVVTYTSLGGVATVANTGSVMHTRMAIALFSPNADGGERTRRWTRCRSRRSRRRPTDGYDWCGKKRGRQHYYDYADTRCG